jgi:hypothetical protein
MNFINYYLINNKHRKVYYPKDLASPSDSVRIIRERQIITHKSAHERDIELEITVSNETNTEIRTIFIYSDFFMPALRVLDAEQKELVLYSNEYTRNYFRSKSKLNGSVAAEAMNILKKMDRHELYILWVRFPDDSPMHKGEPKIIKLSYHDNTVPANSGRRLLFSIPEYQDSYRKPQAGRYDVFYIVKVPENNVIEYEKVNKKINRTETAFGIYGATVHKGIELTKNDGLYENLYTHSLSIRLPPLEEEIVFSIRYKVIPDANERYFFAAAVFSLIGVSTFLTLIALHVINPEWLPTLKQINTHINALLGGIVTVSLAAIALTSKPIMNRTRFWFLIPILISATGFLLEPS